MALELNGTSGVSLVQDGVITNANLPSGSILQVQYTQFTGTNTVSVTADTEALVTDLAVSITPVSTSSILKVEAMVCGEHGTASNVYNSVWYFDRSGTKVAAPQVGSNRRVGIAITNTVGIPATDAASTPEMVNYSYFDTPATTSAITYTVALLVAANETWHLNKTATDSDTTSYERGTSYICVTEIKA